jgi:hypothetical protein
MTWVNRIVRVRERCEDLFGQCGVRWRVLRTSNGYQFNDPQPGAGAQPAGLSGNSSKSDFRSETSNQVLVSVSAAPAPVQNKPATEVETGIERWRAALLASKGRTAAE